MPQQQVRREDVRIHIQPSIIFTDEQCARYLGITLQQARELLSPPETKDVLQRAIQEFIEKGLDDILHKMKRAKWPSSSDQAPARQDVVVELPTLPAIGGVLGS